MKEIVIAVYMTLVFVLNILQIKDYKNLNNDLLFDYVSTNILVLSNLILYFEYHSIKIPLMGIFISIFINFLYYKDIKFNKKIKTILLFLLFLNLYIFTYATLRFLFF